MAELGRITYQRLWQHRIHLLLRFLREIEKQRLQHVLPDNHFPIRRGGCGGLGGASPVALLLLLRAPSPRQRHFYKQQTAWKKRKRSKFIREKISSKNGRKEKARKNKHGRVRRYEWRARAHRPPRKSRSLDDSPIFLSTNDRTVFSLAAAAPTTVVVVIDSASPPPPPPPSVVVEIVGAVAAAVGSVATTSVVVPRSVSVPPPPPPSSASPSSSDNSGVISGGCAVSLPVHAHPFNRLISTMPSAAEAVVVSCVELVVGLWLFRSENDAGDVCTLIVSHDDSSAIEKKW